MWEANISQFRKPSLTIPAQMERLATRGMIIANKDEATSFLECVSYYRLRAYWKPFEFERDDNHSGELAFREGLDFNTIKKLYIFDRKLRLLLLDGIERIEVATRALWTNLLAEKYGHHGYLEFAHYSKLSRHVADLNSLKEEYTRSSDVFAEHYRTNYTIPDLPPVWIAAELISFGLLARFINNLKHFADKNEMASYFNIDASVLVGVLYHLGHVRNICAHHGRIWNRCFIVQFSLPKKRRHPELSRMLNAESKGYLYNTLVMINHFLSFIVLDNEVGYWKENLLELINSHSEINLSSMGFPDNWREMNIWQG